MRCHPGRGRILHLTEQGWQRGSASYYPKVADDRWPEGPLYSVLSFAPPGQSTKATVALPVDVSSPCFTAAGSAFFSRWRREMEITAIRVDHDEIAREYQARFNGLHASSVKVGQFLRFNLASWPADDMALLRKMTFHELEQQISSFDPEVCEGIATQLRRFVVSQ